MPTVKLKRTLPLLAAVVAAMLLAAPAAFGAEVTRPEYKASVEPICKANTQANERILDGVRSRVNKGELGKAATQFTRAATALEKAYKQLKAKPQPTEDEAKLAKWLKYINLQVGLLRKAGKDLKNGNRAGAQAQVTRLNRNANLANSQVLAFGFNYCRFNPSRFT